MNNFLPLLELTSPPNGSSSSRPGIVYAADSEKYESRTETSFEKEQLSQDLPEALPSGSISPLAWKSSDFHDGEWVTTLTAGDIEEIKQAVQQFKTLDLPLGHVCQDSFPLPYLSTKLRALSADLHNGRGFFILRGFPVDHFDRLDCVIAYAGVSSYVGNLRGCQDKGGKALAHVTDFSQHDAVATSACSNERQGFRTDNCDIVSLFALEVVEEGAQSKVASSRHVYNRLAKTRPGLVGILSEGCWPCENFEGDPPYCTRPILSVNEEQKIMIQYCRRLFTGSDKLSRLTTIPPITEAQAHVLDALQLYAAEDCLCLDLKKGDIQYIHNLSVLHDIEACTDAVNKTHLLRLWLRDEEYGWQIPKQLQSGPGSSWTDLHYEARSDEQKFPLEPEIKKE